MKNQMIFVEFPDGSQLPHINSLSFLPEDWSVLKVTSKEDALSISSQKNNIMLVVFNIPETEIIASFKENYKSCILVLVTNQTLGDFGRYMYSEQGFLVDHIISYDTSSEFMIDKFRIVLQKIIKNDIFGIDKYLENNTTIYNRVVTDSLNRNEINKEVFEYAEFLKMKSPISKMISSACEELLMNAIYDAPVDKDGNTIYAKLKRTERVKLEPEQYSKLSYGCDGKYFAIGIDDPFGAFERETFFNYVKKVIQKREQTELMDNKEGGAGLGVYKLFHSCHTLVCNCEPGVQTEVILLVNCALQINDVFNMARSLHYFRKNP